MVTKAIVDFQNEVVSRMNELEQGKHIVDVTKQTWNWNSFITYFTY